MLREINVKISWENFCSCERFFQVYKILTLMEMHEQRLIQSLHTYRI